MSKRTVLLKALAATPADISRLLGSPAAAAAGRRPGPEAWSLADVLAHLHLVEVRSLARLERVRWEHRPAVAYIAPTPDDHDLDRPPAELLAAFTVARQQTLDFLHSLSPGEWQRRAFHETAGDISLRGLVQMLVDHDTDHLNQFITIQNELRRAGGEATS